MFSFRDISHIAYRIWIYVYILVYMKNGYTIYIWILMNNNIFNNSDVQVKFPRWQNLSFKSIYIFRYVLNRAAGGQFKGISVETKLK